MADHCARPLAELRDAFETQPFDPRLDRRSFTLAMADATAAVVVPPLLRVLDAAQARSALRFVPLATRDPRALLDRGDADLTLGFFPTCPPRWPPRATRRRSASSGCGPASTSA